MGEVMSDMKSDLSKPVVIKNDTAFKFWASVDPYCAQLGTADLDVSLFLKKITLSCFFLTRFFKICNIYTIKIY